MVEDIGKGMKFEQKLRPFDSALRSALRLRCRASGLGQGHALWVHEESTEDRPRVGASWRARNSCRMANGTRSSSISPSVACSAPSRPSSPRSRLRERPRSCSSTSSEPSSLRPTACRSWAIRTRLRGHHSGRDLPGPGHPRADGNYAVLALLHAPRSVGCIVSESHGR